jgi:hypothetical protein
MTRARPKFNLPPRGLAEGETAGYLGLGSTEYRNLLPKLEAEGFPKPDAVTGRRDHQAIDAWWDHRSGLAEDGGDSGLLARIEELRHAS